MFFSARWFFVPLAALAFCGCRRDEDALQQLRDHNASLETRLATLEKHVDALAGQNRVTAAPLAPAPAATAAPDVTPLLERIEALIDARTDAMLQSKVAAIVQETVAQTVGTPEDIEAVMGDVVQEELAAVEKRRAEAEAKQREERHAEWEQRRKQHDEERLNAMAEELALNDWQKTNVAEVESRSREAVRAAITEMRESGNFNMDTFRTTMRTIQTNQVEAVSEFLTADQLEQYKARQERDFGGFGMFGRGRRGSR